MAASSAASVLAMWVSTTSTMQGASIAAATKALTKHKADEKSFPIGSLTYGADEFRAIGLRHGGGWSVDMIAEGYRQHMGARLEKLRGKKLIDSWTGFCESWLSRRGRP